MSPSDCLFSIFYPPPFERTVWYYERANTELIRRAIDQFDWVRALSNVNVDEKVYFFTKTLLNIIQNFIPHETITFDDRDPPWINKEIKKLMLEKNLAFKSYRYSNKSMFFFEKFKALQYQLNMSIEESKEKYYTKLSSRLADPLTSPKTYWSILKTFLNNKKIPCIPPLFHENKLITDFKEKAELFNYFFVNQCSLSSNNSVLPTNLPQLTSKCLDSIHFSSSDIVKIISRLDPNKAHGHDMLSIRMIKLCGNSICKPLSIIFKDCLSEGKFPHEWKKANVVPVHKKGNKQSLENYGPISLLPICSKIFERLIYNEMFTFFTENNLISPNQSGFRPGDSCVNQLLAITHEIYKSFDEGFEVRGVFLDISKAFDKVWHEGLLLKLNQNGISGNLLKLLRDFLSYRKQRVVLHGQHSSWDNINTGVPQGSILGPLLFLIYINDLSNNLSSNCKLFADDTSLFSVGKAQEVIFSRKIKKLLHPTLLFNNIPLNNSLFQKHLGLTLDIKLNFSEHIKSITKKISKTMGLLRKFQQILPRSTLLTIYKTFVRSRLDYADIIYDQAYNSAFYDKLESIQYNSCLAITGAITGTSTEKIYQELGLESLKSRRWFRKLCHFYKIFNDKSPSYLFNLIPNFNRVQNTRLSYNIPTIKVKHDYFKNSFFPSDISEWNKLDLNIRNSASLNAFKKKLLNFIRPCANSIFDIHNPLGIKFLTRLRLGLSPLQEHKFRHCFQDTLNPLCECAKDIESTMHFFLHCTNFLVPRQTLLQKIRNIDNNILSQSETQLTQTLLYGNQNYHPSINRLIINSTIEYIISTERFKCSLFN